MAISPEALRSLRFIIDHRSSMTDQPMVEPAMPDPLDPDGIGITDPIYNGLFPPRPDLDFDTLPPPLPIKDDGKPDINADASRMQESKENGYTNGYLRTLANYVLPISPSETHSDLARLLRALVRQKEPARIGVLSYEADVDINFAFSLILPNKKDSEPPSILAKILEIHEDQEGEIYAHAPILRKFAQNSIQGIDIENVGYKYDEIAQVKSALQVLNLLEEEPADQPRTTDVFIASEDATISSPEA